MQILCRLKSGRSCVWYWALFFNTFMKITFMQQDVDYLTHHIILVGDTFLQDSRSLLAQQLRVHILSNAFWQMQIKLVVIPLPACCQWQYSMSHALGELWEVTQCHKGVFFDSQPSELAGVLKHVDVVHTGMLGGRCWCYRAEQQWKQR